MNAAAKNYLYCDALSTAPSPDSGPVLVTGATGYIGGLLIPELLARGYKVRAMVRAVSATEGHSERWPGVDVCVADARDTDDLAKALEGVHTAYYLIHSLLLGPKAFEARDLEYARNFRKAAERSGVKRIIYLGGLGDVRRGLSPHLMSRAAVANELRSGSVKVTELRAAIIIGSGSASYEILRHLVKNVPVLPMPRWSHNRCQPIAVRDVVCYLVGALESPKTEGQSLDIGGPEVMTYEDMLRGVADVLGYRRFFFRFFISDLRIYAYIASLLTPVPSPITTSLMHGLQNHVVCEDTRIREWIPFRRLSYRESIVEAMSREEQDRVHARWTDAYPPAHELAIKLSEGDIPQYTSCYTIVTRKPAETLFESCCRVGGKEGWFYGNWMWRLRGLVDRLCTGVGASRGRRSASKLRVNDVVDFWRVEQKVADETLLLRAEMLIPGRAWLEFHIRPLGQGMRRLDVTAYFETHTLWGRIYWAVFVPFHFYIFRNLIRQIVDRADESASQ